MSNQAVGSVYQTIIDEVINSSRVDFEENAVEESVLEELRQGWQLKLSKLDVARFPWDPKPEPPPATQPAPPPASNGPNHTPARFSSQLPLPNAVPPGGLVQNGTTPDVGGVKQEPGVPIKQEQASQPAAAYQHYNGLDSNSIAANRAAQQLQAQYGNRAAGSINAIQDRMSQQPPQSSPPPPPASVSQAQQPLQALPQQTPVPPPQVNNGSGQANGQTDGPGDVDDEYEGVLLQRGASGNVQELGRFEIDSMLHNQIAAKAKSMEGGGLMLPLKEAGRRRKGAGSMKEGKGVARYDGGDDEDSDENLINSDLDDPESENDDEEVDDEGLGHIMLCMYDKVQRVKNKWKCTLKDGVLTVNGKEYVFHKATGEYEW